MGSLTAERIAELRRVWVDARGPSPGETASIRDLFAALPAIFDHLSASDALLSRCYYVLMDPVVRRVREERNLTVLVGELEAHLGASSPGASGGGGARTHAEVSRDLLALKEPAGFLAVPGRAPAPSGGDFSGAGWGKAALDESTVKKLRADLAEAVRLLDKYGARTPSGVVNAFLARAALDGGGDHG